MVWQRSQVHGPGTQRQRYGASQVPCSIPAQPLTRVQRLQGSPGLVPAGTRCCCGGCRLRLLLCWLGCWGPGKAGAMPLVVTRAQQLPPGSLPRWRRGIGSAQLALRGGGGCCSA